MDTIKFTINSKDKKSNARTGILSTPHGIIETPNFMPVATQGSVKALAPEGLREIGVQVILANTYHLYLRPGDRLIKKFGGLSKFMGWQGPMMTDSGGFQVFSLGIALEQGVGKLLRETDSETIANQGLTKLEKKELRSGLTLTDQPAFCLPKNLSKSSKISEQT